MTETVSFEHPMLNVLLSQIQEGISQIDVANETLLANDSGTKNADIDKVLKNADNHKDLPKKILADWNRAVEAKKAYDTAVEAARNAYRTEVLHEEAKSTGDVDEDSVREVRKVVMDALQFFKSFATGNGIADAVAWADSVAVPQVGRKGTSNVGARKPRVYVHHGDKVYGSFSEAAAALSDKDNKVTAGELAEAWNAAGGKEKEKFQFGEVTLSVTFKPKKSDEAAAA